MIHIAVGTKAQLIKMAPVLWRLKEKNITCNFIDLGQHALITKELRKEFGLGEPDVYLSEGKNIATIQQALIWAMGICAKSTFSRRIKKDIFQGQGGVCLIHGDTLSTVLGLYLAKRAGLKVAHIEAGLRSFHWHEPFPEEILRCIAVKFSDILFAPSTWAHDNLKKRGLGKKKILLAGNTGQESILFSLCKSARIGMPIDNFCLVTLHRAENIFSKKRLCFLVDIIKKASCAMPVVFIQHEPTITQLKRFKLYLKLRDIKQTVYFKILSHHQFVYLLNQCKFVITDGGSIQEEAFYLGRPCLLLRGYTERNEGLGENAVLSRFNKPVCDYFISHSQEFARAPQQPPETPASSIIVNSLMPYA